MRILHCVHGYPAQLAGGTERSVAALAEAQAAAGHEVSVLAGSLERSADGADAAPSLREEATGADAAPRVLRLARADAYFDHWHKGRSPRVAEALRGILRERSIEVVHVHHWLRLTRDLVQAAALEGVPAVVSLNDHTVSCPLVFRVRADTRATCDVPAAPSPCVACAGAHPPLTPWVTTEEGWMALARRQQEFTRELELARVVTAPSAAHAAATEHGLGLAPGSLAAEVVAPVRARGAPSLHAPLEPPSARVPLRLAAWGAISAHKGTDLLLDALGRWPGGREVKLGLIGSAPDGAFEHDLRNHACGFEISFLGPFEPSELADHPGTEAHAFVSGTRARESYGLVLDEAFELGLPVVVPDTPAFLERLGADAAGQAAGALIYPQGDAQGLAAALQRLCVEPDLWVCLAREARAAGQRLAGPEPSLARFEQLCERARVEGAPEVAAPEWFEARLLNEALLQWDAALARCSREQLGLPAPAQELR